MMPKLTLDELECHTENLSEESSAELRSLQFLEAQISKSTEEIQIYKAARSFFLHALKCEIKK
tara:strand:- start:91 stop:279 length:189 start_codon:yes stop_codon:yes gene_type:complete